MGKYIEGTNYIYQRTDVMYIADSVDGKEVYYQVRSKKTFKVLLDGYTKTFDQALRNARNFIRNNQNAVYG